METPRSSSTSSPTRCRRSEPAFAAWRTAARLAIAVLCCVAAAGAQDTAAPPAGPPAAQSPAPAGQTSGPGRTALRNDDDSIKFAVLGDTGTGGAAQYDIARRLAEVRERFAFDFVLMLGDNLYGRENPSDYVDKFERPYRALLRAGVQFYATLGNHDEPSQRFYKPFNMNGRRYYQFRKDDVEFFALDSTYMTPAQVRWLREALEKSDAKWKIPFFHHPLYSSGERHGAEEDLRAVIEPLFLEFGVDVVFAGHEHLYERLKPQKGIAYFTAGGSAKLREGNLRDESPLTAVGFDTDNTFMLVEISGDEMFFEAVSRAAQVVDAGAVMRREVVSTN